MRKFISVLCLIALTLGMLSSCGGSNDQANAQEAYDLLAQAEQICIDGMDDIYNTWRYGIYDADDASSSGVFNELSRETSFSADEIKNNGGYTGSQLVYGSQNTDEWQYCLWAIENCLEKRGDFEKVDSLLSESKSYIQKLSSTYPYSSDFKEYYTKVASYAEFFKSPSGSFEQLKTTILDYENGIRTAKEAFKFDFEK